MPRVTINEKYEGEIEGYYQSAGEFRDADKAARAKIGDRVKDGFFFIPAQQEKKWYIDTQDVLCYGK